MNLEIAKENIDKLCKFKNEYIYFEKNKIVLSGNYYIFYDLNIWVDKIREIYEILLVENEIKKVFNSIYILYKIRNFYKNERIDNIISFIENDSEIMKMNKEITMSSDNESCYSDFEVTDEFSDDIPIHEEEKIKIENKIEIFKKIENENNKIEIFKKIENENNKIEKSKLKINIDEILNPKIKKKPHPPLYPRPSYLAFKKSYNIQEDNNKINDDENLESRMIIFLKYIKKNKENFTIAFGKLKKKCIKLYNYIKRKLNI